MVIADEPADVRFLQYGFNATCIGAFGQPDAARIATETTPIMVARRQDLRAQRRRMVRQQREQRVRGSAGDNFDPAKVLKLAERPDQVPPVGKPGVTDAAEPLSIHLRKRAISRFPSRAVSFLLREPDQASQMLLVAVLQQRIEQHRAKCRRQRQREARLQPVAEPAFHDLNERRIALRDGFKEPVFLQKLFMVRLAYKRKVRVQDQCEITGLLCSHSVVSTHRLHLWQFQFFILQPHANLPGIFSVTAEFQLGRAGIGLVDRDSHDCQFVMAIGQREPIAE